MKKKKSFSKRILSLMVAIALIVNVCFDCFFPFGGLFHTTLKAEAAYEPPSSIQSGSFGTGSISMDYDNFKAYAYYYHEDETFAQNHQNDDISLFFGTIDELDEDYKVLPGHGGHSTLTRERRSNPWMREALA